MTTRPIRGRAKAAALGLCGSAAIALTACTSPSAPDPVASGLRSTGVITATASAPVVVDCGGHGQIRPGQYILICGDGGAYLTGLHWAAWGPFGAYGYGTDTFNDCQPSCVGGHGHSFPALVRLWRAERLPGYPGKRYFTRLTIVDTGSRAYRANGKLYTLPLTTTDQLSPSGGPA